MLEVNKNTVLPQHGAVVKRIRNLVQFCRSQGYPRDEVIAMTESLP